MASEIRYVQRLEHDNKRLQQKVSQLKKDITELQIKVSNQRRHFSQQVSEEKTRADNMSVGLKNYQEVIHELYVKKENIIKSYESTMQHMQQEINSLRMKMNLNQQLAKPKQNVTMHAPEQKEPECADHANMASRQNQDEEIEKLQHKVAAQSKQIVKLKEKIISITSLYEAKLAELNQQLEEEDEEHKYDDADDPFIVHDGKELAIDVDYDPEEDGAREGNSNDIDAAVAINDDFDVQPGDAKQDIDDEGNEAQGDNSDGEIEFEDDMDVCDNGNSCSDIEIL